MDGRRPAQAGAQNPAYRPTRPPPDLVRRRKPADWSHVHDRHTGLVSAELGCGANRRTASRAGVAGGLASARARGRDSQLPRVSMASFTRAMNELFILSVVRSTRLRSGGMRQNDPGWCSIVTFVPEPSGSKS